MIGNDTNERRLFIDLHWHQYSNSPDNNEMIHAIIKPDSWTDLLDCDKIFTFISGISIDNLNIKWNGN